jgi:hypothetical protein
VCLEAGERAGHEPLLRYCVCPAFASERLAWDGPDQLARYTLPKHLPSGQTALTLTPLELLDRLAAPDSSGNATPSHPARASGGRRWASSRMRRQPLIH